MARIPGFLLRHRIRVAPPTATFGQYGTEQQVRCLIDRELTGGTGARTTRVTVRAQRTARHLLVEGARVTLPDGGVGYVQAAIDREAGGLPVPEHLEAEIATAVTVTPGGGETVVLLRRVKTGKHPRYGNDLYATTETPVDGVTVAQVDSTETHEGRADSSLAIQVDLTFPAGTVVKALDRVRVRGLVFELIGQPLPEPTTGLSEPFTVRARRVTG